MAQNAGVLLKGRSYEPVQGSAKTGCVMMELISAAVVGWLLPFSFISVDAQGCGGSLSGVYGQFWSENYPNRYPLVDRNCTWHLTAVSGTIIQLEFLDFDLEPADMFPVYNYTSCKWDFVTILDPVQRTSSPAYCGNTVPAVTRGSSNVLTVVFASDDEDSFRGFKAEFRSSPCPDAINDCEQICVDKQGSKVCFCYHGYKLNADGKACDDLDECVTRSHNCSQTCINHPGSYTCSCNPGYRLMADHSSCTDIDECAEDPDICDQRCYNLPGVYACGCETGYTLTAEESACEQVRESTGGYDESLVVGLAVALAASLLLLLLVLLLLCCCNRCLCAKDAKKRKTTSCSQAQGE